MSLKTKTKKKAGRPLRKSPPKSANKVGSLSDLAGILGVSYETCRKAQQDGDLIVDADGRIDVEKARVAMEERATRVKGGGLGGATSESKHWDTELKKAKAIREQLIVKQRLGELVEKSEVIRAQIQRELAFKTAVMGNKIAAEMATRGIMNMLSGMGGGGSGGGGNPNENAPAHANSGRGDEDYCGGVVIAACGARCESCGYPRQCGL